MREDEVKEDEVGEEEMEEAVEEPPANGDAGDEAAGGIKASSDRKQ